MPLQFARCVKRRTMFDFKSKLLVWSVLVLASNTVYAAFVVSSANGCYGSGTDAYYFSEAAFFPDYVIMISDSALFSDITFRIVDDPQLADLVVVDGLQRASMRICKQSGPLGEKTVQVSESALFPDVTVNLSDSASFVDYNVFVRSGSFSEKEADALFAVIS